MVSNLFAIVVGVIGVFAALGSIAIGKTDIQLILAALCIIITLLSAIFVRLYKK